MDARERELLTGMGNCYAACQEDFESTIRMVAHARDRDPEEVRATLAAIRDRDGTTEAYRTLRSRLPEDFPL